MTQSSNPRQHDVETAVIKALRESNPYHPASIPELISKFQTPGVSVAVFKEGEIDWAQGYGVIRAGQPAPITATTRFQAASISKPVAALAALRMVEAGLLDLDGDLNDTLKSWKVPAADGWTPRITLRMLLSHSGGLTQHGFLGYPPGYLLPSLSEILNGAPNTNSDPVRPTALPGLTFSYSGGGTTIVQLLMIERTGQDFPSLMREWVLDPLGMNDSGFHHPPPCELEDQCAQAHYYNGLPLAERWFVHPELAAAGLWTTPTDLARFGLAIQAALRGEHPFISRLIAEWMTTPQVRQGETGLGLGFFVDVKAGEQTFGHTGGNVGFRCNLVARMDGRGGFAIMTNSDKGGEIILPFDRAIREVYGWKPADATAEIPAHDPALAGHYTWENKALDILLLSDTLALRLPGQMPLPLTATAPGKYAAAGLKAEITFERDEQGGVSVVVRQAEQVVKALRTWRAN